MGPGKKRKKKEFATKNGKIVQKPKPSRGENREDE